MKKKVNIESKNSKQNPKSEYFKINTEGINRKK